MQTKESHPFAIWLLSLLLWMPVGSYAQTSDSDRLGMAIEYFQSGKYHECMLILQKLDNNYKLNPRFKAYLGVCYYYEWDYKKAALYLDQALPKLEGFAPQERSFYYFADAESHFYLKEYDKALPLYEKMVTLCHEDEKPDSYYKIGFIYAFKEQWIPALDNFQTSLVYYQKLRPGEVARIAQIKNMIKGCTEKIDAEAPIPPDDAPVEDSTVGEKKSSTNNQQSQETAK